MEEWKHIKGNENYQVSNLGRVRSVRTGKIMSEHLINSGYQSVVLYKKGEKSSTKTVHRLVAQAFIPNPDNLPVVNHIDNDRLNNKVENLEWTTYKGNSAHAKQQGRLNTESARESLKKVSSKAIHQKDKDGNIVRTWNSTRQAHQESEGFFSEAKISAVANGHRKYHRNFIWEFVDKESTRSKNMKINMYDLEETLLHEGLTMSGVMNILKMNNHKTLRDKLRKEEVGTMVTYKEYKFKFVE